MKEVIPMKTEEELNALKGEVETLSKKLRELTDEELAQVSGGYVVSTGIETFLGQTPYDG